MNVSAQIAQHVRAVYFGGNWTSVNLRETLAGVTWQQATASVHGFNTVAALLYHVNYYVNAVSKVLQGAPLKASDKFSFDHPVITSEEDWETLVEKTWGEAEAFAVLIENLPEAQLGETFADEKYGSHYRNLQGIVEHLHYHLGQMVLIKKLLHKAR